MTLNLRITDLFTRRKTIKTIKAEDLRKERIGLENEERRLEKDLGRMRGDEQRLRAEYAVATEAKDTHQRRVLARRLQDVGKQMGNLDQRHAILLKQMTVVSGLAQIKDNEAFFERIGASSAINRMDIVELQQYVEQASLDGELNNERLAQLVESMDQANSALSGGDEALDDFMADLDAQIEADPTVGVDLADDRALDDAIDALDRQLGQRGGVAKSNAGERA